jgi:ribosomal protein uS17
LGQGTAVDWCFLSADKKCPFTGMVSIRGRILTGSVVSTKMHRTIIIRREYLHYIPKYNRYEKRHKNLAAHVSPAFRVEEGDQVTVGQCRPLSKTVRFRPEPSGTEFSIADIHLAPGVLEQKTDRLVTGPLQRPPRPPPDRQGGEGVQQVLKGLAGSFHWAFLAWFCFEGLELIRNGTAEAGKYDCCGGT